VIEKKDFNLTPVMRIDDAGAAIDAFFYGQSASGPDQPHMAFRNFQPDSCRYQSSSPRWDRNFFGCGEVGTGITGMGVLRNGFASDSAGKRAHSCLSIKSCFGDYIRRAEKEKPGKRVKRPAISRKFKMLFLNRP
jgi:hypothetical protein